MFDAVTVERRYFFNGPEAYGAIVSSLAPDFFVLDWVDNSGYAGSSIADRTAYLISNSLIDPIVDDLAEAYHNGGSSDIIVNAAFTTYRDTAFAIATD
jgi:hypothetical protein